MRDFLATTMLLAALSASPALAQSTTNEVPAEPVADSTPAEGEILVTARRREESIKDVPGTIAAVTGDQLAAKGPVVGAGDLLSTVAGVRFNSVASENLSEISIRGSGTQRATGADSSVGLFVNGAYIGSSTLGGRNFKTLDYFDVERVEALQGPQGGLYGRNSEFGVVNIVLAKPQFRNSGWVRDTFTFEQNQNRLAGVVNQELSDTVAVRLGAETYGQTKGFYYDPNKDKYYDRTDGWNGRGQIRYRSGPLDVTLLVEAQDLRLPTFVNSYVVPPGVNTSFPLGFMQDRFVLPHTGQDGLRQNVQRMMLMADYDFGWATLTSTTMAMRWRSQQQFAALIDLATAAQFQAQGQTGEYPFGQTTTDVTDRTLYQDLHLAGSADDGKLSWIFGGEALYQKDHYRRTVATSPCPVRVGASFCTGTPAAPICIQQTPTSAPCPTPFPATFGVDSTTRQRIYSFAAYGSLQYTIGDLSLAGEARLTHDYKTATQDNLALYTTTRTSLSSFVFEADQPTYTATVSYKFPSLGDALVYGKIGTGYRAGGVNNGIFIAVAPNPFISSYDNENTISYEAGVKANLTRTIFARLSVYISRTNDAITAVTDGCTVTNACGRGQSTFNVNGGTIHARGLEMALDGRFPIGADLLTLSANASTQRARFAEVPAGRTGLPLLDSSVPQIPGWTMSANANYKHVFGEGLSAFVNVNYSGQRGGTQDAITAATPAIPLQDFDLFGLQVGVDYRDVQLALSVRNLTDQQIEVLRFRQGIYPLSVRYNQPRTIAASLTYRW